jgi:hypothetical protein
MLVISVIVNERFPFTCLFIRNGGVEHGAGEFARLVQDGWRKNISISIDAKEFPILGVLESLLIEYLLNCARCCGTDLDMRLVDETLQSS